MQAEQQKLDRQSIVQALESTPAHEIACWLLPKLDPKTRQTVEVLAQALSRMPDAKLQESLEEILGELAIKMPQILSGELAVVCEWLYENPASARRIAVAIRAGERACRIRTVRRSLGMSLWQFGQALGGYSWRTVESWERGERTPSARALRDFQALVQRSASLSTVAPRPARRPPTNIPPEPTPTSGPRSSTKKRRGWASLFGFGRR